MASEIGRQFVTSTICASKVAQPVRVGSPLESVQYACKQNPKPES